MDVRFQDRRASVRRQQRQRRLRRTLLLVAVAALVVIVWVVERSPLVGLATVLVEGNEAVTDQVIIDAADLALGTSTLRLDLGAATARVAQLAPIETATIDRLDAVTVRIRVVERVAELRLHTPAKKWLVDAAGVVFAAGEGPGSMPVVLVGHEVRRGATATEAGLVDVLAVHSGLTGPLRSRVGAYRIEDNGDVALLLEGNLVALLGDGSELEAKVRALGALLDEIEGTDVTTIDVRVPDRPTVSEN